MPKMELNLQFLSMEQNRTVKVMDMRNARINFRDEKAISFHVHLVGIARSPFARLRAVGCFNNRLGRIAPPITSHPLTLYVVRQHRDSPLSCLRARTHAASRAIFVAPGLFRGLSPYTFIGYTHLLDEACPSVHSLNQRRFIK